MTAVSAIVFFLGLLFGFQRPSRLLLPRLLCYRASSLHPVQPGGCILYFEAAFLSSGRCRSVSPLRLTTLPGEGRGTYFTSASRVNSLRRLFLPPRFDFRRFEGRRLLPPPRWESTSLADFVFRLSLLRSGAPGRQCDLASRPRGAASIALPWMESTAHFRRLIPLAVRVFQRHWPSSQYL